MATESTKDLALGSALPPIALTDAASGRRWMPADAADAGALLVAFICNHCPYVIHVRPAFVAFAAEFRARGLAVVAISSNDPAIVPQDGPDAMAAEAKRSGFGFPYLYDETQATARAFGAACTPEFFLFDANRRLAYHGRFDGTRPGGTTAAHGSDLRAAVDAVLAGRPAPADQKPALGCSIKWRPTAGR
ncbi:MAG TPA: thioredoxin family protein [Burkholderiaceae bacterium]|nr:thioredoxin family protein [Burkholderiaceae bacterium]